MTKKKETESIMNDDFKRFLGMGKIWQNRLSTYIGMVNFTMIFYLYILESPLDLLWYHWMFILVSSVVVILYIDIKFIFPAAQQYASEKNPFFVGMRDDIILIKNELGLDGDEK